jgi:hypothetical protein
VHSAPTGCFSTARANGMGPAIFRPLSGLERKPFALCLLTFFGGCAPLRYPLTELTLGPWRRSVIVVICGHVAHSSLLPAAWDKVSERIDKRKEKNRWRTQRTIGGCPVSGVRIDF